MTRPTQRLAMSHVEKVQWDSGVGTRSKLVRILPSSMLVDFRAMGGNGGCWSRSEGRWPE